jgi:nucleotide-binding universal stress UspA family protein
MFKKILFPTDFSEHSSYVKKKLIKMKDCGIEEVVIINVARKPIISVSPNSGEFVLNDMFIDDEVTTRIKLKLKKWVADFDGTGIKVTYDVVKGNAFEEILKYSEKENCTSIFMGVRGLTKTEKHIIGSTAEKVARKAQVSVFLI